MGTSKQKENATKIKVYYMLFQELKRQMLWEFDKAKLLSFPSIGDNIKIYQI